MATETIVFPDSLFKKKVFDQYNNPMLAIAREILQNSQDAGATKVEFTLAQNEFSASDNGKGMTLDEFRSFYLTMGGSKKETGSIGGFGAAKELLSYAWDTWMCKGQGWAVTGHGINAPESRADNSQKKGFFVGAADSKIDQDKLANGLQAVCGLSDLSVKVSVNGEEIKGGRKLRKSQLFKEYEFGSLYVHKSDPNADEQAGWLYVRTRGLYTCATRMAGDYVYYLDLTVASPEVLTENRDSLRWSIQDRINSDLQTLIKQPARIEVQSKSKITVYGEYCSASQGWSHQGGYFDLTSNEAAAWRKPFAVAEEDKKADILGKDGQIKPKYARMLEIWSRVLNMVQLANGMDPIVPGLYFGTLANGMHSKVGVESAIFINVERIDDDPFAILELAMHEAAHNYRSDHSQEFETARMAIARKIGSQAMGILHCIEALQKAKKF